MNKIKKFLAKLNSSERKVAETIIARLVAGDFTNLNIKKLQGVDNIFRARKGDLRILYSFNSHGKVIIFDAVRKNDTTYNF